MAGFVALDTTGLKEALAGLDKVERMTAAKDLRREFQVIADAAVAAGRSNANSRMQQAAARTLVPIATSTGAGLRFGAGFGGAFGAEYGGMRNQRRVVSHFGHYTGWNQFKGWKGSDAGAGYFMWPGIREAVKANLEPLADAVSDIFSKGG